MSKKLLMTCTLVISGACLFSGCGFIQDSGVKSADIPVVAEYIAKTMLKHDTQYLADLQDTLPVKTATTTAVVPAVTPPDPVQTTTPDTSDQSTDKKDSTKNNTGKKDETSTSGSGSVTKGTPPDADTSLADAKKLSDIYSVKGFDVVYGGASVHKTYPEGDSYFSVSTDDGRKLYVITFSIVNKSGKKAKFVQNNEVSYNLTFDDQSFYKPSMTLLENDMQFIEKSVGAGKSMKGVLIFSVPENVDRSGAKLYLSGNKQNYLLTVVQ